MDNAGWMDGIPRIGSQDKLSCRKDNNMKGTGFQEKYIPLNVSL